MLMGVARLFRRSVLLGCLLWMHFPMWRILRSCGTSMMLLGVNPPGRGVNKADGRRLRRYEVRKRPSRILSFRGEMTLQTLKTYGSSQRPSRRCFLSGVGAHDKSRRGCGEGQKVFL